MKAVTRPAVAAIALMTVACSAPKQPQTQVRQEYEARKPDVSAVSAVTCKNDVSQRAAHIARAATPASLSVNDRRLQGRSYISRHRWELFDIDHNDRMTFDEYLDSQWAFFLAQQSDEDCRVSKQAFLAVFLGEPGDPKSFRDLPGQEQGITELFDQLDTGGKGYLTREDLRAWSASAFHGADRFNRGYLTRDELP